MKDNLFNEIPELEEILFSKSLADLTEAEKEKFLQFLTEEEFNLLKNKVIASKKALKKEQNGITLDPNIKFKLDENFKETKKTNLVNWIYSIFNYRLPAYQLIAVLVISLFFLLNMTKDEKIIEIIKTKTDTVFVNTTTNIPNNTFSHPDNKNVSDQVNNVITKTKNVPNDNTLDERIMTIVNLTSQQKIGKNMRSEENITNYLSISY